MQDSESSVLFLSYHFPLNNEPGAFRPLMEALLLRKAGFQVTVVTSGVQYMTGKEIGQIKGWCNEEFVDGIRVLRLWGPTNYRRSLLHRVFSYVVFASLAFMASLLKVGKVGKVFAGTDPMVLTPVVYLVSLLKKANIVLDERDLYPETLIGLGILTESPVTKLLLRWQNFFRRRAHAILAATPGIRRILLEYGCPERKVHLLYNADVFLDESKKISVKSGPSLREKTGKTFLIGYAGGLGRANDVPVMLRAAKRLRELEDIGIVIIGSGENREKLIEAARESRLTNFFVFEAVPREEARYLLSQMDICVQPLPKHSHFSNTLTSKTFDYHGLGIPMIFCGCGDTVELLRASHGGISVPPGDDEALADKILYLRDHQDEKQRMGASARSWFINNINIDVASSIMKQAVNGSGTTALEKI